MNVCIGCWLHREEGGFSLSLSLFPPIIEVNNGVSLFVLRAPMMGGESSGLPLSTSERAEVVKDLEPC